MFNQFLSLVVGPIAEQSVSGKHEDEKIASKEKTMKHQEEHETKIVIENRNGKRTELKKWVRKEPAIFCKKNEKETRQTGRTSKFSHVNEIFMYLAHICFTINYFLLTLYLLNPYNLPSIGFNRKGDEGDNNPRK